MKFLTCETSANKHLRLFMQHYKKIPSSNKRGWDFCVGGLLRKFSSEEELHTTGNAQGSGNSSQDTDNLSSG